MTTPEVERLTRVEQKVDDIRDDIGEIKDILKNLDKRYASKVTERIVYGLVGMIVVAVFSALVANVIK